MLLTIKAITKERGAFRATACRASPKTRSGNSWALSKKVYYQPPHQGILFFLLGAGSIGLKATRTDSEMKFCMLTSCLQVTKTGVIEKERDFRRKDLICFAGNTEPFTLCVLYIPWFQVELVNPIVWSVETGKHHHHHKQCQAFISNLCTTASVTDWDGENLPAVSSLYNQHGNTATLQ